MTVCVFGASGRDIDKNYIEKTEALGRELAKRGHTLMFGGGANGLMGAAARGFTEENGRIIGVAPEFFNVDGILYDKCDEFIYPASMRDRKKYMEDNSSAFIIAPGGIGTFEEFFEVLTLKQLARHGKPIAIYNIGGYYDELLKFLGATVEQKFTRAQTLELYLVSDDIAEICDYIENGGTDVAEIEFLK